MRIVLVILLCSIYFLDYAQDVAAFPITQQQGLPSNTVYNLFQSRDGFMWIATENGLARYNGYNFRSYENTAVRSRAIGGLFEDRKGRIWMHNFFGEILFVENDTLNKLNSWEEYYSEGFPSMTQFNDTLLVTTVQHAYFYSIENQKWKLIDSSFVNPSGKQLIFGDHKFDRKGNLWFCYGVGKESFITNQNLVKPIKIGAGTEYVNPVTLRIVFWKDKTLVFDYTSRKLFEVIDNTVKNVTSEFASQLQQTRDIVTLGDSLLAWIGNNGAHLLDTKMQWQHILSGKNISCITADREGGLWLGTLNEGIFYVPQLTTRLFSKESHSLPTKLLATSNFLFVGNYDGSIGIFNSDELLVHQIVTPTKKEVQSLYVDTLRNQMLVFTDKLHVYSLGDFKLKRSITTVSTKKIISTTDGYLLATSHGVLALNANDYNIKPIFPNQRITAMGLDEKSGKLWIGAQKGLFVLNVLSGNAEKWTVDSQESSPGVSDIIIQADEVILATLTDGIYFLKNGKLVGKITMEDGLPSNRVSTLIVTNGELVAGTDRGISIIKKDAKQIRSIDYTKGLAASEIYDLRMFQNQLWVAHPEGLQQFVSLPKPNGQQSRVFLTSVSTDGRLIGTSSEIVLQPSSQQLTLSFDVSNNLRSRGKTVIRYRIKGFSNDEWQETTLESPVANYLALPSGSYTLEANAVNEDGITSENIISIPVHVLAPFWKQSWFLVLTGLIIVVVAMYITFWWLNRLHRQRQLKLLQENQEQQLRIAQLTSIRAQMNPHFIFNTLSSIQGKILNGQLTEANDSIQGFAQLLRKVLELSSNEMVSLQEEIDVLQKYLAIEKDRFNGSFEYEIRVDENAQDEYMRIPSLLTQPFVENALRHGLMHKSDSKNLVVDFAVKENMLVISIDDNGIGRQAAEAFNQMRRRNHQSFALNASQKRIELLNASKERKIDLQIIDKHNDRGLATGTTVVISLPLIHDNK